MPVATLSELTPIFEDETKCNSYLVASNVFYRSWTCSCNSEMKMNVGRSTFRCTSRTCRREVSIRKGTLFYGSRLSTSQILRIAYLWIHKVPKGSMMKMTGHNSRAISEFCRHFEHLTASAITEESCIIGGDGIIVEIDEAKLGKRKYHRGHRVEGVWIVSGIERTPQKRVFAVPVETRDAETLMSIIRAHVAPGSIVHTDCWRGYSQLSSEFTHLTVNHSLHFVNPQTGTHTNSIEGFWNGLKLQIPPRNRVRAGMETKLLSVIWRKQNRNDLWTGFLTALKEIHYEFQ